MDGLIKRRRVEGGSVDWLYALIILIFLIFNAFTLTSCFLVIQLPVEALSNHVFEAPGLLEWFEGATEVGNPDALLLALKMREKAGVDDKTFGKLLPSPYSLSSLFSADHLSSVATCLKVIFFKKLLS